MTRKEWKVAVLPHYMRMKQWLDSPYRQEREYAGYVKRFLFGDGEMNFLTNETWKKRAEERRLPMPANIYLMG